MTTGAAATGVRAWLAARAPHWLTPARLRCVTVSLFGAALNLSTVVLGGSGG